MQLLSFTICEEISVIKLWSALRPGYRFRASLNLPAYPAVINHLPCNALVTDYLSPAGYRLARWPSCVGQPHYSPSLISSLFQEYPKPFGVVLPLPGPVLSNCGYWATCQRWIDPWFTRQRWSNHLGREAVSSSQSLSRGGGS